MLHHNIQVIFSELQTGRIDLYSSGYFVISNHNSRFEQCDLIQRLYPCPSFGRRCFQCPGLDSVMHDVSEDNAFEPWYQA